MPATVQNKKLKLFHASMQVMRLEEWCVEAESAKEAQELLASGAGHRCTQGEKLHVEFDRLLDE